MLIRLKRWLRRFIGLPVYPVANLPNQVHYLTTLGEVQAGIIAEQRQRLALAYRERARWLPRPAEVAPPAPGVYLACVCGRGSVRGWKLRFWRAGAWELLSGETGLACWLPLPEVPAGERGPVAVGVG